MPQRIGSRTALALVLTVAFFASGDGRAVPSDKPTPGTALKELNEATRAAYRRSREEALARGGPVVLRNGDDLILRYGALRQQVRATPPLFHDLKSFSHVALGLHALLVHHTDRPLSDERLHDLRRYRDLVAAAALDLGALGLAPEQTNRQKRIVRSSLDLLDDALKSKAVSNKHLLAFARRVRPWLDANATEAARLEIDGLHRALTGWRAKLTERDWGRLKVVVMGSQMPRRDNLAVQYFARLLGERGEGRRMVYAEGIFDEARALALLGTHLVDTRIGEDFYDEPLRMHRDLLGDAARAYLDELFRKAPD